MILCIAGDPGGSRAVLPLAEALFRQGKTIRVPRHGTLARELPPHMAACLCDESEVIALLPQCKALVFGSSTDDAWPLAMARAAKEHGAIIMHVLDNWSSYRERLCTDGLPPLMPDIYATMDEESRKGAEAEGVPADSLVITGHPGLAAAAGTVEAIMRRAETPRDPAAPVSIAFVCEPFSLVFGRDCRTKGHPGFTEEIVLKSLAAVLASRADPKGVFVYLLPHPKQRPEDIARLWEKVRGPLEGRVLSLSHGRDALGMVSGVAGMASILLYEAWMGGLPVLSVQQDCRMPSMRRFASLKGINYADTNTAIPKAVEAWLRQCRNAVPKPRPELLLHKNAPKNAVKILLQRMGDME